MSSSFGIETKGEGTHPGIPAIVEASSHSRSMTVPTWPGAMVETRGWESDDLLVDMYSDFFLFRISGAFVGKNSGFASAPGVKKISIDRERPG